MVPHVFTGIPLEAEVKDNGGADASVTACFATYQPGNLHKGTIYFQ